MHPNSVLTMSAAIMHYRQWFRPIEVPWIISREAGEATCPEGGVVPSLSMGTTTGYLPASAEQSFVDMMLKGELDQGDYMAISPCYRDDAEDRWHRKAFFKLELIIVNPVKPESELSAMVWFSRMFFRAFGEVSIENTAEGFDITHGGIELGSYGIRSLNDHVWIYGTGCAEPRTTLAFARPEDQLVL